jgi:hypothetical protein
MQNKFIFSLILGLMSILNMKAQVASDAFRLANTNVGGTARFEAVSGAMGALGADYAAICVNPGGIGLYRKSDFAFSFLVNSNQNSSTLKNLNQSNLSYDKIRNSFSLSNIGFVTGVNKSSSNWLRTNFVIGFNQSAQFAKKTNVKGQSQGSILDRFLEQSLDPNGEGLAGIPADNLDDFEAGLAYEVGAIFDPISSDNKTTYIHDLLPLKTYGTEKSHILSETGTAYNLNIGFGGNYKEKLFVGGNLNFPFFSYKSSRTHFETPISTQATSPFVSLEYKDNNNQSGGGINIAFGAIVKPNKNLRFGLAYQSPSYISITESYNSELTYVFKDNSGVSSSNTAKSPDGLFEYALITPQFVTASFGYVAKFGFLTADVQYKDFNQTKYLLTIESDAPADAEYQKIVNADIDKQYKSVWKANLGAELALDKSRIRLGTSISQSPFANEDKWLIAPSAGLGYRGNKTYFDVSFSKRTNQENYLPYITGSSDFNDDGNTDAVQPIVETKLNQYQVVMTFGFKF